MVASVQHLPPHGGLLGLLERRIEETQRDMEREKRLNRRKKERKKGEKSDNERHKLRDTETKRERNTWREKF